MQKIILKAINIILSSNLSNFNSLISNNQIVFFIFEENKKTMQENRTICAISTARGTGAIAVIRISGEKAIDIFSRVIKTRSVKESKSHSSYLCEIIDKEEVIDQAVYTIFKGPTSYTGEDTIEISCHGSLVIQNKILNLLIKNGASAAMPGEFTQRAFLNGKMDLAQSEAVADLISSSSEVARKTALSQLKGEYSKRLKELRKRLIDFSSLIELELDFSEEDVEFASRDELLTLIEEIKKEIQKLVTSYETGNVIKNGIPVAIVGKPNVGKSTLLNLILNEEKAIVSDIPGTTRDSIEDTVSINGVLFRFIDTAGIRKTDDEIESIGVERAFKKLEEASVILLLVEANNCLSEINMHINKVAEKRKNNQQLLLLVNKTDMVSPEEIKTKFGEIKFSGLNENDKTVHISAKNNSGIDDIFTSLEEISAPLFSESSDIIVTNARHLEALHHTLESIKRTIEGLESCISGDFIAQDIRQALYWLGTITGEVSVDDILGNIFGKFCIGK